MCERWVRDRTKTATYWTPNSSGYHSLSFPFSWTVQPGAWDMAFIPASFLQLIWTSCRRGYIIIWHPPTSCERHICTQFNPSTVKVIPWSLRPDAPVIYTGAFLLLAAWPGSICNICIPFGYRRFTMYPDCYEQKYVWKAKSWDMKEYLSMAVWTILCKSK